MIPLRDNIPSLRRPYVNYAIIGLNCLMFFLELSTGPRLPEVVQVFGFVPGRFLALLGHGSITLAVIPAFTSMFMHAGWLHLLGNMWTLFIFGDNVEDTLGRGRYLLFYLLCGLASLFLFLLFSPGSATPLVGASGAIAGVMGAYFSLFPGARVLTLVPIFIIFTIIELPAYVFLGFWFVLQFFLGTFTVLGGRVAEGGVAWWAHVGGFLAGMILVRFFAPDQARNPLRWRS